jgi:hypothetical protein
MYCTFWENAGYAGFLDENKRYTSMISSSLLALVRDVFTVWVATDRRHTILNS